MQPLKLVIPGSYWDSQIYEGRLYLFGRSGDILALNWDSLIHSLRIAKPLVLALTCAFQRSDYLYGMTIAGLMNDPEIRSLVSQKFERLRDITLEISINRLRRHSVDQQDNPLPFPHTDCVIYSRKMYVASKSGVSVASCNKKTVYPVSTRANRIWDAPTLSISASYGSLAIAAGSEGLFEKKITTYQWDDVEDDDPRRLSQDHCTDCGWAFYSVFGSSSLGAGFLASFEREETDNYPRFRRRRFDRVIVDSEIFGAEPPGAQAKYSWASQDKIYRAVNGTVDVARYTPWKEPPERIEQLGTLSLRSRQKSIISAAVALFGTVVEFDSSLAVILSSGRILHLRGEPVNWRVFPRSKHYENHLHVIYDDHIEILSFNHDYLVNQDQKLSGIRHYPGRDRTVRPL